MKTYWRWYDSLGSIGRDVWIHLRTAWSWLLTAVKFQCWLGNVVGQSFRWPGHTFCVRPPLKHTKLLIAPRKKVQISRIWRNFKWTHNVMILHFLLSNMIKLILGVLEMGYDLDYYFLFEQCVPSMWHQRNSDNRLFMNTFSRLLVVSMICI